MSARGVVGLAAWLALPLQAQEERREPVLVIRAAKILTMGPRGAIDHGAIVVRGGKIVEVGENVKVPDGATVLDAGDAWALPGLVDLHCHSGNASWWDINEMNHPVNPELSIRPVVEPDNELLRDAVAGGVTTVLYIPGSGTNLGGFGVLMKTGGGRSTEDLLVRFPGAMKVAQAWNPERWGGDLGASRMGMWWILRRQLDRAKAYHEAWSNYEKGLTKIRPDRNAGLDLMRGLFAGKVPVIIHTADARDIMGTVRIFHEEYGLAVILSHGEDNAYRMAPEIARRGLHVDVGPRLYDPPFWSFRDRFIGIASEYWDGGVRRLSINTDSPVVPEQDFMFQAAMAVRHGLPERVALEAVTIAPARAVLAEDRVGSLEPGKDADVVLWSGPPLDVRSHVRTTIIRGRVVYDAVRDGRRY
ncbi:MAG: amidohydrolase family protein [Planctomycetes bacterium]|nr:amidohydrolase family protein [Planctomycetota bacterium]